MMGRSMTQYEYRVIPAPRRAKRVRGMGSSLERFAATVAETINDAAAEGWEFLRSETLPLEERRGLLRGRVEVLHSLLVFRRPLKGRSDPLGRGIDAADAPATPPAAAQPTPAPRLRPAPGDMAHGAGATPPLGPARGPDPGPEAGDVPVIRLGTPRRDGGEE